MASNPWTFSPVGVDAMTGGYFAGGVMSADVPHFHPSVLLEHAGFGFGLGDAAVSGGGGAATAPDLGGNFAASSVTLASFASQLFATAPAPLEEVMDGGYGVAGGGSCGQSEAMAVWPSPSFKKPAGTWSSAGGSRATSVHEPYYHLAGLPDAAGLHYQLAAAADAPASSELSLTLCSKTSSGSALHAAADQCSSAASRSALTELPPALYPRARPATIRPAHFAVVVARSSRYAAVAQGLLNDAVGRLLDGVAGAAAADSCGGSAGAPSVVSSNSNRLMAASSDDGGAAQSAKSDLLKMLQLIDEKYNQCLDEIQSTTAKFNTLMHSGGGGGGVSICTPFAHRAVSAVYRGLRRRIAGEIMAASGPTCWGESSSSVTVTAAGDAERSWESAFIQKHWAAQQLRRGEQQCWRPQRGLPEKSVAVLKAWMFANFLHPYPKDNEKDVLAARSGLTRNQVSNWFINARVRLWKPMIEEMYQDLKKGSGVGGDGAFAVGQAMEQHTSKRRICELADGQ